jgi:uncharacterized protein (DUF1330 family)
MKTVNPDPQRLPAIFAGIPLDTPVVMVNLLRFRETALYKDGPAEWSGREAYRRYSEVALAKLAEIGAEVIFIGDAKGSVIAPPEESWDEVLLVRYPSIQVFMGMMASPDFREASKHRTAALDDARLIATVQGHAL